ncbi:hypothetical protein [Sphaerotilus sp.]|uniref:hypothetical protein n=1 Tax=Sphaerotilus sp. TaxID=2093942 RepID=UPI00286DDE66|nr:hypothetical protein [Sphaerotilus sp.]
MPMTKTDTSALQINTSGAWRTLLRFPTNEGGIVQFNVSALLAHDVSKGRDAATLRIVQLDRPETVTDYFDRRPTSTEPRRWRQV